MHPLLERLGRFLALRRTTEPRTPDASRVGFGGRTLAGVYITPDTAVQISAVWACLRYLSQAVAVLPWHVLRETQQGPEVYSGHPIDWLVWKRPNAEWSSFQFRETLTHWALRWGNGYAEIEPDQVGRPFALWPVHPERVEVCRALESMPEFDVVAGELFYEVSNGAGGKAIISMRRMFHIRGFGDGPVGVNVMDYAAQSLGWAKAAQLFGASFFGNGANVAGVVTSKKGFKDGTLPRLKAEFSQLYRGVRNSNKTAFLDNDMDWKAVGIDPRKSQLIEINFFLVEEVCFVPGTGIITPCGLRSIETLGVGDMVLTHQGRWRRINRVMRRDYVGSVITAQAKGLPSVTATTNHPFYVQPMRATRGHRLEAVGEPEWVEAGRMLAARRQADGRRARGAFHALTMPRLKGVSASIDMAAWSTPAAIVGGTEIRASSNGRARPIIRKPDVGYDLGWLCGLFAAEGSTSDHQVMFYIGAHEPTITEALQKRLADVFGVQSTVRRTGGVDRTVVSHRILAKFFADFGRASHLKALPPWCMSTAEEFQRGAIDGLVAGDGCVYERRSMVRTTSPTLAWQLRILLWASGVNSTLQTAAAGVWAINGRTGVSREMLTVEWQTASERRGTMGVADGQVYFNLDVAERATYSGPVYNLEVDEDESYTTEGGCVHNCRWFGVPPHKVMHLLRSTFNNIEHQAIEVVVDSVAPWVKRFEDEADCKLFGQNRQGLETKMNMRGLLRGDFKSQNEGLEIARHNGIINADEWRALIDMNRMPAGAGGGKYTMQSQYTTLEHIGEKIAAGIGHNGVPPIEEDDDVAAARAAMIRVLEPV